MPLPLVLLSGKRGRHPHWMRVGEEKVREILKKQIPGMTLDQTDIRNKQHSRKQQHGLADSREGAKEYGPYPDLSIDPLQIWRAEESVER